MAAISPVSVGVLGRAARKPLCVDLFCGLGGWAEGFLAEGYDVIGFDVERHCYGLEAYPGVLILQSVLELHGGMFKGASCIVASPPCQEYSYMAMPWSRGKQIAAALRGQGEFPAGYTGSRTVGELRRLFDACFRIQREACEAAGRHIPMVVENVRGAIPWVGRSAWNYGSFHLWGDVPALMPSHKHLKQPGRNFHFPEKFGIPSPSFHGAEHEPSVMNAMKTVGHVNKRNGHTHTRHLTNQRESDAVKNGKDWFGRGEDCSLQRRVSSKSDARKAASAQIAKIPFPLASHIARVYKPLASDPGSDYTKRQ